MKKALSIILCLAMLMTTVPMSVFAAPTAIPVDENAGMDFVDEKTSDEENDGSLASDSVEADLAASGTVSPVKVLPETNATVDRRYPVAYYTFDKSVVINPDDVTLENINNQNVGGVYFEEDTNTIWVFPRNPQGTVYYTNKVSYTAWTSNIKAQDGSLLHFTSVSFNLSKEMEADGENLVPFGNFEYGWTPASLSATSDFFNVVEDPSDSSNHVLERAWDHTKESAWPHAQVEVSWKPSTTYKISVKVMFKDFVDASGKVVNAYGANNITPDLVYNVPYFYCSVGGADHGQYPSGTTCSVCGNKIDREHESSNTDHTVQEKAVMIGSTDGNDGWKTISFEITTRDNLDMTSHRRFSLYSNPISNPAGGYLTAEYYLDDISVYEKVATKFDAGRNASLKSGATAPASVYGYNGDSVSLPKASDYYECTKSGYAINGWTDGDATYTDGTLLTVDGAKTLTPNVVPEGDSYEIRFSVPSKFDIAYDGPSHLVVAADESVDLTDDEFALGEVSGYILKGWKSVKTGEIVTSVVGNRDEIITLEATYVLKTSVVFDSEDKMSEIGVQNINSKHYDSTLGAVTFVPSKADPIVTFDGLSIDTNEYSYVDVTYINNQALKTENGGEVYFVVTGITSPTGGYNATATLLKEDGNKVTYRYNLVANSKWQGTCSMIRVDPFNRTDSFSICSIELVRDTAVEKVEITDVNVPAISGTPDKSVKIPNGVKYAVESVTWSPEAKYFAGSTEYTLDVKVRTTDATYLFDNTTSATVNGKTATITPDSSDCNYATISYTFPKTEKAKDITLEITSAKTISTNNGTLTLTASVSPVNASDVIAPDTVSWAITGGDADIAELDGNVLTAIWDGTVEVTATSDYNSSVKASATITITGQKGSYVVYNKGTADTVTNVPATDEAKKSYKVSETVPVRSGYKFEGWTTAPEGDVAVKNITVTDDTMLYAMWSKDGKESLEYFSLEMASPVASAVAYTASDVTVLSEKYTVKSVSWTGADLIDGKYFDDDTAYTANITLEVADGYVFSNAPAGAFMNEEDATVSVSGNNVVVSYTFDKTEDLVDFTLVARPADDAEPEITVPCGTLQLETKIYTNGGVTVPNREVTWSIDASQKRYATVDENGLVTADINCDALIVTATSKYDPTVKATVTIRITGQYPEYKVTFNKGTGEDVTGIPEESFDAKGEYTLPTDIIPVRKDYAFLGWSRTLGGDIVKKDNITANTTYYAVWAYSKGSDFTSDSDNYFSDYNDTCTATYDNGVLVATPANKSVNEGVQLMSTKAGVFSSRLNTSSVQYLQIKTNLAPDSLEMCIYVQTGNSSGAASTLSEWSEKANLRLYSNTYSISYNKNQSLYDYVEKDGDWYIYTIPASMLKFWEENSNVGAGKDIYLNKIRFNFIRREMDVEGSSKGYFAFGEDEVVKLDYIRFIGKDVPEINITLDTPVVKAEGKAEATVAQNDRLKVTGVTWSPALLSGIYFDSGVEYTATVTVEAVTGLFKIAKDPAKITVNGNDATFKRNTNKKATITFKFPATENIGTLKLVNLELMERDDTGVTTSTSQIFSGDDFNIDKLTSSSVPKGYRCIGWSMTDGGETIKGNINVTEDTTLYAVYEKITSFDFANVHHRNKDNISVSDATMKFDGNWALITPDAASSKATVTLGGMNLESSSYDYIEVIYDANLSDDNKFTESFSPALKVVGADGDTYTVELYKSESAIANNRVSRKYIYDLTANVRPEYIASVVLAPYVGTPEWAFTSVVFVPNEAIEENVAITDIKAPETWNSPDVSASVNSHYEIERITWTSDNGFNADGSFKEKTVYTVNVTVKAATGYKITSTTATIDGKTPDSTVLNSDGTLTVKYTYPETDSLVAFTLSVADATIDKADGTVKLVPVFTATNAGETVPVQSVHWAITNNGPDDKSATIDENGVVKAAYDGVITVVATADYNPLISATATVTITNQIPYYVVTFDKNTTSNVTGMPEEAHVKFDYTLPSTAPVRDGFNFAGWIKNPTDTVSITSDYISKDVTYYALWVKGLNYEFIDGVAVIPHHNHIGNPTYDTQSGTFSYITTGNDPIVMIGSETGEGLFKGSDITTAEIRLKADKAGSYAITMYFESLDKNGNYIAPPYNQNSDRFLANKSYGRYTLSPDGYTTIKFDLSQKSDWTSGDINYVRLDIPDDGSVGVTFTIDYIRFVNYETSVVEITGIDAPVAKGVADKDAVSKDTSKYVVTDVSWEGGLLYDYYFDGDTEYTACVTVKGTNGYFVSDVPTKATINGKEAKTSYNKETGELTLKYTFPKTGALSEAEKQGYNINLIAKDDSDKNVTETRTFFVNDKFDIGTYLPTSVPAGKRWIGWSENQSATENTVSETITVNSDKTYYAVYENLVEFDYSNYYHTFGTTSSAGGTVSFVNDLCYVTVGGEDYDAQIFTPAMNISGLDFAFVEVYYSAFIYSIHDEVKYDNKFNTTLKPALKFSTVSDPTSYTNEGTIVKASRVKLDGREYYKYTYDMTTSSAWTGDISSLCLDPYNGYPNWGVRLIKLVPNEVTFKSAEIELASPEAWYTPDIADNVKVNEEYSIVSVNWSPANDVFAAETEYTVNVTFKPSAGYSVSMPSATINDNTATVNDNGNGTFTANYTFEATAPLKETKVEISGGNKIADPGFYLQLTGKTVAVDGSALPEKSVTWSVENKDNSITSAIASISENGRVYAKTNGTVIVTATSVYDPSVYATLEVTISNQADLCTVTFDKNTADEVTGMPESVQVIGTFVPENYQIKRDGFFFAGWSTDEDATTPDTSFNITEDTTLYAKWGKGIEWSFDDASTSLQPYGDRIVTYSNGIATLVPKSGASQVVLQQQGFYSSKLETAKYRELQIRFSLPAATSVKWYLQSTDGTNKSEWSEAASMTLYGYSANKDGGFQTASFDTGATKGGVWDVYPYVEQIRLDLPTIAETETVKIDFVRLITTERKVTFDGNGGLIPLYNGEVSSYKDTFTIGSITLPDDPSREGYEFLGWAKATEDYTKLYNNKFTVSDDVTLYAIWTPAAVLSDDTVSAEGGSVKENKDGSVSITSDVETTPVIKVADSFTVVDNNVIVVKADGTYKSVSNSNITLSFKTKSGETKNVVISKDGIDGETVVSFDLSDYGFEGTVTDVTLTLPTGVVEKVTVDSVAFTTKELSATLAGEKEDVVKVGSTANAIIGGTTEKPGHNKYPSLSGGASVPEHSNSNKVTDSQTGTTPARPKDEEKKDNNDNGTTTTPTKPANTKFAFTKEYDARFKDVTSSNWFYSDVEKSYKLGLMNGRSEDTFDPNGTVSLAEAITIAARMNAIYNGTTIPEAAAGESWYTPYVNYATSKAIITSGQFADYTASATREQVALIFVRALPATWYKAINMFTQIPDVASTSSSFASILRLYNAGVITGVDENYNFKPNDNIKRSEISAVINRVAIEDSRLRVVTEEEKNSNTKIFGVDALIANVNLSGAVENSFKEVDGYAYAMAKTGDPIVQNLQKLIGNSVNADEYKTITIVMKTSDMSLIPAGHPAKIYFSSDTVELSEGNAAKVSWPAKANEDGTVTLKFDMSKCENWKGSLTFLRFDPFDVQTDFSLLSVTFSA